MSNVAPGLREKALFGPTRWTLLATATAILILYYLFFALALLFLVILILCELAVFLGLARLGLGHLFVKPLTFLGSLCKTIVRSLFFGKSPEYRMAVSEKDAPGLYALVRGVADAVGVQHPDEITLTMDAGAYVTLPGYKKGSGRCLLNIGFDLLAMLSEDELRTVVAHEMAHALLVDRGYTAFLGKGIGRMANLKYLLSTTEEDLRGENKKSNLLIGLLRLTSTFGKAASRLQASYRRHGELAADAVAARLCGAETTSQALVRSSIIHGAESNLYWRDRVVQTQREGSFSEWLRAKLTPSEEDRVSILKREFSQKQAEFDSHPPVPDRLQAMGCEVRDYPGEFSSSLELLADPDGFAERLISEMERIAAKVESAENARLLKEARQRTGHGQHSLIQLCGFALACFSGVVSAVFLFLSIYKASLSGLWCALFFGGVAVFGMVLHRVFRIRYYPPVPVPQYGAWQKTLTTELMGKGVADWADGVISELLSSLPEKVMSRKQRSRYWAAKCYEFLESCDYKSAYAASRLCLDACKSSSEGRLTYVIACMYFGLVEEVQNTLTRLSGQLIRTATDPWCLAWVNLLSGDVEYSEGYLLQAVSECPDNPSLWSILANCKWRCGKEREAIDAARKAVSLAPDDPMHRRQLAAILVNAGWAKEAAYELAIVREALPEDRDVLLSLVRNHLSLGDSTSASQAAQLVVSLHPTGTTRIRLGQVYLQNNCLSDAEHNFNSALEQGFYPGAHMGLAWIAHERKDIKALRSHLACVINLTQEVPEDAETSFDLLPTVFNALKAFEEAVEGCMACEAYLNLKDSPAEIDEMCLFIIARTADDAVQIVRWVYESMLPGYEFRDSLVRWVKAKKEDQPEGPVIPGVYGLKWE